VGALLGIIAAPVMALPAGPLLAVTLLTALTGGLHEDGLADTCDAVRGYRTRERMHEILKDSRVGAHGALAIVFSVLIRWQALTLLEGNPWLRLPAAYGLSRASMVFLAAWSHPAGHGLGADFVRTIPAFAVPVALVISSGLASLAGWPAGAVLVAANAIAVLLCRAWFHRRLGGITGDSLGFQCQVSEALSLAVLACL
jgi:adenosylcobinamide-GDP ribazoletransferase